MTAAPKQHLPALDGLRAVAVLLVIWTHVPADVLGHTAELAKRFAQAGYLGVDIFFVLSGFLITRILLVDRDHGRPLSHFLARRFLRIFPIYYLTLALLALLAPGPELKWCALYVSNFYFPFQHIDSALRHTWSLAVEEHFYLVWPMVVYLLRNRGSRLVLILGFIPLAIASAVLAIRGMEIEPVRQWIVGMKEAGTIDRWDPRELIYQGTLFRASSLAIGSLFAYAEALIRRRPKTLLLVSIVALVLAELLLIPTVRRVGLEWFPLARLLFNNVISGSAVLIAITLDVLGRFPVQLLSNAPMRFVGRISYGLYLYHYPIFHYLKVEQGTPDLELRLLGALALTFAMATVSYRLIERPLLSYANRFRGRPAAWTRD